MFQAEGHHSRTLSASRLFGALLGLAPVMEQKLEETALPPAFGNLELPARYRPGSI